MCFQLATLNVSDSVKWLKFNYMNTGFYIVHYGDEGWATLIDALKTDINTLTPHDRASLIHNIFALSRSVCVFVLWYGTLNDHSSWEMDVCLSERLDSFFFMWSML